MSVLAVGVLAIRHLLLPVSDATAKRVHRWSGRLAIVCTLIAVAAYAARETAHIDLKDAGH
mgnify:CR=1 FL=1